MTAALAPAQLALLERLAWDELPAGYRDESRLAAAVAELSARYTRQPGTVVPARASVADLAARLAFWLPADVSKAWLPLAELRAARALPARSPVRILDAGAGLGAMSLCAVAFLGAEADVTLRDHDRGVLEVAARLHARWAAELGLRVRVRVEPGDLTGAFGRFDLVLAGNVLNELGELDSRLRAVRSLLAVLEPDGALIIVEPALRDTARALHALRDAVVAAGDAGVFAPCLRQGTCPMLRRERDWCHEERAWTPPPRLVALAARAKLHREEAFKMAYLVLRRDGRSLRDVVAGPGTLWRVVSQPLVTKGKHERVLCGPGEPGHVVAAVLDRERTEANAALTQSARGDLLRADLTEGVERARLAPDHVVDPVQLTADS